MQSDATRLYGSDYVILQDHGGGKFWLVQCGSCFLTNTEICYVTIKLELLSVVMAMGKCRFYLVSLHHFDLVTDHSPLITNLNRYSLDAIENPPSAAEEDPNVRLHINMTCGQGAVHS